MLRPFFKPTRKDSLDGWKFSLDDEEETFIFMVLTRERPKNIHLIATLT